MVVICLIAVSSLSVRSVVVNVEMLCDDGLWLLGQRHQPSASAFFSMSELVIIRR